MTAPNDENDEKRCITSDKIKIKTTKTDENVMVHHN